MKIPNVNYLHAATLLREFIQYGARRVVISPGSRSAPLAHVAMDLTELDHHIVIDERSAGFFALGLSRADGAPAILICTSGTAAANYYPAVIEAAQSHTPLIVLTADRPLSLRNTGAPQTIDQSHLYGDYPKFFADLPAAEVDAGHCREVRAVASQAVALSLTSPCGPVHLNVPLDEPLAPIPAEEAACHRIWNELQADQHVPRPRIPETRVPPSSELDQVRGRVEDSLCGLIVCGPNSARTSRDAEAILNLARQLGWPVFADIVSGVRFFGHPVIPYYDVFLREADLNSLAPDVVLAFGAFPTSKVLNTYLDHHRSAHTIRIQPHLRKQDPTGRATETVEAEVSKLCDALAESIDVSRDSLLLDPFQRASGLISGELENPRGENCEALYVREAIRLWPDGANLALASSLSIRYADAFAAGNGTSHAAYALRGANGIDGTISYAAGIAAASRKPTLLITGDLAFCHDLNGLMTARALPNLTILLLNNDGGGIFHFLPAYGTSEHFEWIQGTPHSLKLSMSQELFGLEWRQAKSPRDLAALLDRPSTQARVVEVVMTREENCRAHTALFERLSHAAVAP